MTPEVFFCVGAGAALVIGIGVLVYAIRKQDGLSIAASGSWSLAAGIYLLFAGASHYGYRLSWLVAKLWGF